MLSRRNFWTIAYLILLAALAICFIMHVVDSINNWRP